MTKKKASDAELLSTLGDFTSRENWDKFFTVRGSGADPFEWYVDWPTLRGPLLSLLSDAASAGDNAGIQILVPGCGNSQLSEFLYDAGFHHVTNIDFSKVVISDMLRRHVRERPEMRWRIMDMTNMHFTGGSFDVVLDKGGLDALMEPKHGSKFGSKYLSEVKRVLRTGGIYVCLTLAESHVLGLLFSKFRFGWKIEIQAIPHKPSNKPTFETFLVVFSKDSLSILNPIVFSFDQSTLDCKGTQGRGLLQLLEIENKIRTECSSGMSDIVYSFEDLLLGVKGDLKVLAPGRRIQVTLGEHGESLFSYKAVLLDSKQQSDPFRYNCGVFLVPNTRAHEWLFSSEEGQWTVVESSEAARLIMVFLDTQHICSSMDDIQKDLSPLVKDLAPGGLDGGAQFPFMMANDGVKQRNIVQQITSPVTGPIIVEDVIYENGDCGGSALISSKDTMFRRITFERSLGLVQSEALLIHQECTEKNPGASGQKKTTTKSRKKGSQRRNDSHAPSVHGFRQSKKVDHDYLTSSYHTGIISGFTLVASHMANLATAGGTVKMAVIGLGAGLLPMFLRRCMPFSHIEVVELDPVVLDLAKTHFGFTEDDKLKVHIADGIGFVRDVESDSTSADITLYQDGDSHSLKESLTSDNGNGGHESTGFDVLIIDADSADMSSGLSCPPVDFTEESFLFHVKKFLCNKGLFVINLVSRSQAIRDVVISRMNKVFSHLFCIELESEVNKVLFALSTEVSVGEDDLPQAAIQLQQLLNFANPARSSFIVETAEKIKYLK